MLLVVKKLEAPILCSRKLSLADVNKCCQLCNSHQHGSSCDYLQAAFKSLPGKCWLLHRRSWWSLSLHLGPRAPLGTISSPAVWDLASAAVGLTDILLSDLFY